MMDMLRRSISGWAGKVVLGLILGVFAVAWSIADGFSGASSPNTVLTAGSTRVTLQDYQFAYEQRLRRVAQRLGRRPTPEEAAAFGIDQQVLSQLSEDAVLDEQGRRLGLGLSEAGLVQIIADDPAFQDASGNFSRSTFRSTLQNAGLSEAQYIDSLGETALRTQIVQAVTDGVDAPGVVATALGLYAGERRTADYVTLAPQPAAEIAEPSVEALDDFYQEGIDTYRAPELRGLTYAVLAPDALGDPAAVTEEQIVASYEANADRYTTPERRRIQQIVFPDQAAAEAAADELAGGTSFENVATAAGRSAADIDLGLLTRSQIPDAAIAEAAFGLAANQPSGIVSGVFGPAILRVNAIEPEGVRPLDEVRDELREQVAADAANETVNATYDTFDNARGRGATLEEAATEAGLSLVTVEAVDSDGKDATGTPVPDLPGGDAFLEAAFVTDPGFDNPPVPFGENSFVFYEVTNIVPSRERPLDEVRERVVADWKEEEAQRLLEERATALKDRIEAGETLAELARSEGLSVSTASSITRSSGNAEIGQAATRAAFSGPSGLTAAAPAREAGQWTVLTVTGVAPPADPLGNVPAGQAEQLSGALRNDVRQSYVGLLQRESPIDYNEAAVQAVQQRVAR